MVHDVFVYGTLRRGGSAAGLLPDGDRREARLEDHALYGLTLPYPFAVPVPGCAVVGEVVRLGADAATALQVLDEYEGDEYRRVVLPVVTSSGVLPAWVWVAAQPESLSERERIETGDWLLARGGV